MSAPEIRYVAMDGRTAVFADGRPVGTLKKASLRGTTTVWDAYDSKGKRVAAGKTRKKDAVNALVLSAMGLL